MLTSVPFELADTAEEKMVWDRVAAGAGAEAEESMSIGEASESLVAVLAGVYFTTDSASNLVRGY